MAEKGSRMRPDGESPIDGCYFQQENTAHRSYESYPAFRSLWAKNTVTFIHFLCWRAMGLSPYGRPSTNRKWRRAPLEKIHVNLAPFGQITGYFFYLSDVVLLGFPKEFPVRKKRLSRIREKTHVFFSLKATFSCFLRPLIHYVLWPVQMAQNIKWKRT